MPILLAPLDRLLGLNLGLLISLLILWISLLLNKLLLDRTGRDPAVGIDLILPCLFLSQVMLDVCGHLPKGIRSVSGAHLSHCRAACRLYSQRENQERFKCFSKTGAAVLSVKG